MHKYNIIINVCILCLFLLFCGCGEDPEPPKKPVVRKKILKPGDTKPGVIRKKIKPPEQDDKTASGLSVKPDQGESEPEKARYPGTSDDKTVAHVTPSSGTADIKVGDDKKKTDRVTQPETVSPETQPVPDLPAESEEPVISDPDQPESEPGSKDDEPVVSDPDQPESEPGSKDDEPVVSDPDQPESELALPDSVTQPETISEEDSLPDMEPDQPSETSPPAPDEPAKPGESGATDNAIASIIGLKKSFEKKEGYDPANKTDPFIPLFKDEKPVDRNALEEADSGKKKKKKKRIRRIRRTPLEKVDLSNLKLVAIIRAQSGNKALVQDTSNKGYIITKGTYIGIHYGKVKEIRKNSVIVEEEDEDAYGEVTYRERVMKMQKPPGEDFYEM